MCHFLSAIVTRSGEVYHHPLTDHHSDLIAIHKLKEGAAGQQFVRVEFTPRTPETIDRPEDYVLTADEPSAPAWFDDERRDALATHLRGIVTRMIVRDRREVLLGGAWIIAKGG